MTLTLDNIVPIIGGFTPSVGPDAAVQQACGGSSIGYDTTTSGSFGQFTNGVNGSASGVYNTQELCYSLSIISEPVGSTAVFSINSTNGVVTLDSGTTVAGDYEFQATLTDAAIGCVTSIGSLSTTCDYTVTLGTPYVDQAICFGPTAVMGTLDTTCNWNTGGSGYPMEVFFGASQSTNNGGAAAGGSKTNTLLGTIDSSASAGILGYINQSSNGGVEVLRYYNVLQEARYGTSAFSCGFPIASTPAFSTGELTQGVLKITVTLSKSITTSTGNTYYTNFTILYRANSGAAWQLATQSNGVVMNNGFDPSPSLSPSRLEVFSAPAMSDSQSFLFNTPGEYAVRNNGVYNGDGCNIAPAGCLACAEFKVDFEDGSFATGPDCSCLSNSGPL